MSAVTSYVGFDGPIIELDRVDNLDEIIESIDAIYTAVMDHLPEGDGDPILLILEECMDKLQGRRRAAPIKRKGMP
jgi:hypothetical protein